MHDTTIRGGTLVDGSGRPRYQGDIGIDEGRITAVGGGDGQLRRRLRARAR